MLGDDANLGLGQTIPGLALGEKIFDRYTIRKSLGRGAMGVVWLAHDEELDVDVALKFLPPLVAEDRSAVEDLKRETRRARELAHKNIVKVYHFENRNDRAAISMEYVDGQTLADVRDDQPNRCLTPQQILPWLEQIVDALEYAHDDAKMVHRDLKPKNIMLTRTGRIKITDFGIASTIVESVSQMSMRHPTSGTPPFMSPQQIEGRVSTPLDDIYSLGATLYDLLTSKPPFYRGNPATIAHQIANVTPPSIAERRAELQVRAQDIPFHWEQAIARCLEKDPSKRPQTARDLLRLLQPKPERPSVSTMADDRVLARYGVIGIGSLIVLVGGIALFKALERPAGGPTIAHESLPVPTSSPQTARSEPPVEAVSAAPSVVAATPTATPFDAEAELARGDALRNGRGVSQNFAQAMACYQRAAAAGSAQAMHRIGVMFATGTGVQKDDAQAVEWYSKAADEGLAEAQFDLGVHYILGLGVPKDEQAGVRLYEKAAAQGWQQAIDALHQRSVAAAAKQLASSPAPRTNVNQPPPTSAVPGDAHAYSGKVGQHDATFDLRFARDQTVAGSYTDVTSGQSYRLTGRNPEGQLVLDEYTGDKISAHIELKRTSSSGQIKWEGMMHNAPPDNRQIPVWFSRASSSNVAAPPISAPVPPPTDTGEHIYRGTVGPYSGTFHLQFGPGEKVSGTYSLDADNGLTLRVEGKNPPGKMFLDEYTNGTLTAHIELSSKNSGNEIRWEGTMYNVNTDNKVYPVTFSRTR